MKSSRQAALSLLGLFLVALGEARHTYSGHLPDWTLVTSFQKVILPQDNQPDGGLFVQALQIRTKTKIGTDKQIIVKFISNGTYVPHEDARITNKTVTFNRTPDDKNLLTHELRVKLSDPAQYKLEGCSSDWANFDTECGSSDDDYDTWTVRKNYTKNLKYSLMITCNRAVMANLSTSDMKSKTKYCDGNWTRAMEKFEFIPDENDPQITINDGSYRLPPGCLNFPVTWYNKNLRTDAYFPISYEKTFRLHCYDDVTKYRLLVGDREITCNPYRELVGGFGYSTPPDCVHADLRDWRSDVDKAVLVPLTLEMEPLQIRTTSRPGSNKLLSIQLFELKRKISVKFSDPMKFKVTYCEEDWVELQNQCGAATDDVRVWTIKKERDSPITIFCNGNLVVDFSKLSDSSKLFCKRYTSAPKDQFWIDAETDVTYTVKADLTTWRLLDKAKQSSIPKEMNLEKYPLQFKTTSALGSGDRLAIDFKNGDFMLNVGFTEKAVYNIHECIYTETEIDLAPCYAVNSNQNEIIWTLERKGDTVLVFCNGIQIIDYKKKAQELKAVDSCVGNWNPSIANKLAFYNDDDATKAYRFIPKRVYTVPTDWTGIKTPTELPVVDGTTVSLSCVSDEEINNGTRVVTCNPRYPEGFEYQSKPKCIRADGEVTFEPQSAIFVHDLLNPVQFTCIYFGLKVPDSVVWQKDSDPGVNLPDNEKYDIVTGSFDQNYRQRSVLKVKNLAISDDGVYTCKWIRTKSSVTDVTGNKTITVRTLKMAHEGAYYSTNGSVNLACVYSGKTAGTLEWFHKSVKITAGGKVTITKGDFTKDTQTFSLSIKDAIPEKERGEYKCVWSKDDDRIEVKTEVYVRQAKILSDLSFNSRPYKYVDGKILELQCQFDGDKEPIAVNWWKNGNSKIIFDGDKRRMNTNLINLDHGVRYFSNITLEEPTNINDGEYICQFSFDDGNHANATAKVVSIRVNHSGPLIFFDYNDQTDISIGCSLQGDLASVGASVIGGVLTFNANTIFSQASTELKHKISDVSFKNDGVYECTFSLKDGVKFSASQKLVARKAILKPSLNSTTVKHLVSGFKVNLTCDIGGGATSIEWFKNDIKLTNFDTVSEVKVQSSDKLIERQEISLVIRNDNDDATDYKFRCQGGLSVDESPDTFSFNSSDVPLRVFPARANKAPKDAHAYAGDQHVLSCQFPDNDVKTEYSIIWKFNENVMSDPGLTYDILTKRNDSDGDAPALIETSFTIKEVNGEDDGKYSCSIKWKNGVTIEPPEAKLMVRSIIEHPQALSMASGASASLGCAALGDKAAVISFFKENGDDDALLTGVNTNVSTDDQGRVTTVGTLTPTLRASAVVYCVVQWDGDTTQLKSNSVSLTVLTVGIKSLDNPSGWVTENSTVNIECASDLLSTGNGGVYPEVDVTWMLRSGSSSSSSYWINVDGNKVIKYEIQETITKDDKRISTLQVGPIGTRDKDVEFKCEVNFKTDNSKNFSGGKVSSEGFKLKIHRISNFTLASDGTILKGGFFYLACSAYAPPKYDVTFHLTNDKNSLDSSKYSVVYDSRTNGTAENPYYIQNYTVKTAGVALSGDDFYCSVQFNNQPARTSKHLRVITYYDCTKVSISSINDFVGMDIAYEDHDGDRTARIVCPSGNDTVKYIPDVTGSHKEKAVCSKSTGSYEPPQLATCKEIHALLRGRFEQVWTLDKAKFSVCDAGSPDKFSESKIKDVLSKESDVCGAHQAVPCLKTKECTLDSTKTGCRWDDKTKTLKMFYEVALTKGVWSEEEKEALVNLPAQSKLRFWDCSTKDEDSSEGKYLKRMIFDAESNTIIYRGGKNVAMYIGIAAAILVVLGLVVLVIKRKKLLKVTVISGPTLGDVVKNRASSYTDQEMDSLDGSEGTASHLQMIT